MDAYVEVFIVFFIMLFPVWDQNWQGPDSDPRMNACAATLMAVWLRFYVECSDSVSRIDRYI
jgi:hypothetical protein